jgi:hypothetical protein
VIQAEPSVFASCQTSLTGYQFLLCQSQEVNESLHQCFTKAPVSLMRPLFIVTLDPSIQVGL